ncbi:MAG TPA: hypothetical protein ENG33_03550, partial [Chloroflexi bacterium]|nr:hypothetical protein [Chloroflexota bacterium]
MSGKDFAAILDQALNCLREGKDMDTCLSHYPEEAEQLRPLLEIAIRLKEAGDTGAPPRERLLAARERFLRKALESKRVARAKPRFRWSFSLPVPAPGLAMALATLLLMVLIAGAGLVWAASQSLPDSPLYAVKLTAENFKLSLTFDPADRTHIRIALLEKRFEEIYKLSTREQPDKKTIDKATKVLENQLREVFGEMAKISATSPELPDLLEEMSIQMEKGESKLAEAKSKAAPQAKPAIDRALALVKWGHTMALTAIEDPSILSEITTRPIFLSPVTPSPAFEFTPSPTPSLHHTLTPSPACTISRPTVTPHLTSTPYHPTATFTPRPTCTLPPSIITPTSTPTPHHLPTSTPTPHPHASPTPHHPTPTSTPQYPTPTPTYTPHPVGATPT